MLLLVCCYLNSRPSLEKFEVAYRHHQGLKMYAMFYWHRFKGYQEGILMLL